MSIIGQLCDLCFSIIIHFIKVQIMEQSRNRIIKSTYHKNGVIFYFINHVEYYWRKLQSVWYWLRSDKTQAEHRRKDCVSLWRTSIGTCWLVSGPDSGHGYSSLIGWSDPGSRPVLPHNTLWFTQKKKTFGLRSNKKIPLF